MISADYISTINNTEVEASVDPSLLSQEQSEINVQNPYLCFICDSAATDATSIRLQYGQTMHSKTDLPIKLGQLIGDNFMVIVSVDDRLCFACIKLINLADKLEFELDAVKKVITDHLKTKYQLLDEHDDTNKKFNSSLKYNSAIINDQDIQHNWDNESFNKTISISSCVSDKTNNLPVEIMQAEFESDLKTIEERRSKDETVKRNMDKTGLIDKQSAVSNECHFVIKEMTKINGVKSTKNVLGSNTVNVNEFDEVNSSLSKCTGDYEELNMNICPSDNSTENKTTKVIVNAYHPSSCLIFKCTICEYEFQTQVALRKHFISKHSKKWSCCFCSIVFGSNIEYQTHMKIHDKNVKLEEVSNDVSFDKIECSSDIVTGILERQNKIKSFFKCKNCKFKSRHNYVLDKHEHEYCTNDTNMNSKTIHRNIKCSNGRASCKTRKQLSLRTCNMKITSENRIAYCRNKKENLFKYECGVCSVKFSIKSNLISHLKNHKGDNSESLMTNSSKDIELGMLDRNNENIDKLDTDHQKLSSIRKCLSVCDKQLLSSNHINRALIKSSAIVNNSDDDKKIIEVSDENTAVSGVYFDNVKHFMALTTSNVEDEVILTPTASNGFLKENEINSNYNKNEISLESSDEKIKTDININDLINTSSSFSCDKCKVSFGNKSDFEQHFILLEHKNSIELNNSHNPKSDKSMFHNRDYIIEPSQPVNEMNSLVTTQCIESDDNHRDNITNKYDSLCCQNCSHPSCYEFKRCENMHHSHNNSNGDMMMCNICYKYINKNYINDHYQRNHKNIYCQYCSFETKNKNLMRQHMKEHNDKSARGKDKQQGYLCQFCSETFKTKKLLLLHKELHPENFEFSCNNCNKKFMKERQLKRHHDEVHRDPHCYYCGKQILNLKALKSHEQRHMRDLHTSKQLECDICKRVFKTRTGLRHHFATHTGKFKYFCDFCQRGFMSRMMLEEHRSRHTKEDRYVCDVCGRKFTFQSTYWIHRKWHDNPFPYKCNFCGRLFRHTSLLAVHKRKHTGERPYKCPHCSLSFTVGGTLKRHLILHTQKFPFSCETCKRGFTTKHKYSLHLAKAHDNYELLNDTKLMQKQTDFKMVVKEKPFASMKDVNDDTDKLSADIRERSDDFEFIPNSNFTLVNMEEDDTENTGVMMPCIMTVNNEENSGLVFEIISNSPLQPISNGINIPESTILPDMWCE